jgi:3-hydroxyisobutyrate dehydrogenase-like beta-hydroxyacid dehydrogenase
MRDVTTTSSRHSPRSAKLGTAPLAAVPHVRSIDTVGVVGAGAMSAGIAERLAAAGFAVTLYAESEELLDEVLARVDRRAGRIEPTCWYVALSTVDAVILCGEECEVAIQSVIENLQRVMKDPSAILRTTGNCTPENVTDALLEMTRRSERTYS